MDSGAEGSEETREGERRTTPVEVGEGTGKKRGEKRAKGQEGREELLEGVPVALLVEESTKREPDRGLKR